MPLHSPFSRLTKSSVDHKSAVCAGHWNWRYPCYPFLVSSFSFSRYAILKIRQFPIFFSTEIDVNEVFHILLKINEGIISKKNGTQIHWVHSLYFWTRTNRHEHRIQIHRSIGSSNCSSKGSSDYWALKIKLYIFIGEKKVGTSRANVALFQINSIHDLIMEPCVCGQKVSSLQLAEKYYEVVRKGFLPVKCLEKRPVISIIS